MNEILLAYKFFIKKYNFLNIQLEDEVYIKIFDNILIYFGYHKISYCELWNFNKNDFIIFDNLNELENYIKQTTEFKYFIRHKKFKNII